MKLDSSLEDINLVKCTDLLVLAFSNKKEKNYKTYSSYLPYTVHLFILNVNLNIEGFRIRVIGRAKVKGQIR